MGPQNQDAGRGSISFRDAHMGLWRRKGKGGGHPRRQEKDSRQSKSRGGEIRSRPGQRGWSPGHTGGHRTEAVTPAQ